MNLKKNFFQDLIKQGKLKEIREIRLAVVKKMLDEGEDAAKISCRISQFNEQLIQCVCSYFANSNSWLSTCTFLEFGSGARGEQVLSSDQDNGLLLADHLRIDVHELDEVTQRIVMTLDGAGIYLCPGKVMLSEAKWRGTWQEWREKIIFWLENPKERGSWQSGLILDFKPLWGKKNKAQELRLEVLDTVKKHPVIFRMLVEEILQYRVPLSFWGGFILEKKNNFSGINVKKSVLAHIVNAARLLSLKYSFLETNTLKRIEWLINQGHITEDMGNHLIALWKWLQLVRLKNSYFETDQGLVNYLNPYLLPKEEKKLLKKRFSVLQKFLDLVLTSTSYGL